MACLERGEVDDRVDGRVLLKDLVERLLVGDVGLVELGAATADELNAIEGHLGRVVEVIYNHDIVAVLEQGKRREGANVAGATVGGQAASAKSWDSLGEREVCGWGGAYPVIKTVPTAIVRMST